eukprot:521819-Heterocapsa_arctica.AAC.1
MCPQHDGPSGRKVSAAWQARGLAQESDQRHVRKTTEDSPSQVGTIAQERGARQGGNYIAGAPG